MQKAASTGDEQLFVRIDRVKTAFLEKRYTIREIIFLLVIFLCLTPWASPPLALLLGLIVAQVIGHPFQHVSHKVTSFLLKASVVGLGFGINFQSALKAGSDGFLFTVVSIAATLLFGALMGKLLSIEKKTSYLISSGTAICGGSAIAAIAPVIDAEESQISVALGTVFILNSVALFVFPEVGTWLHMSQNQFGLWAAIAIHDTSSVVGAASKYGPEALQIATTVKLARSLWIIPLAVITSMLFRQKVSNVKIPWFIGLFVLAMLASTYMPFIQPVTPYAVHIAKSGLTVTLFLIGAGLSVKVLKKVGWKPLLQGVLVWAAIAIGTLFMILNYLP
ncbi:MAG: putative sulfate exporter family transporter [Chlorobiales bacterium]|nr:putative sulfate exporter family transporter [Chlorobiales bacterium]